MKVAKLLVALLVSLCMCAPQMAAAEELPVLSVDGRGSASVAPDQAVLTVGVVSTGRSASQAQAENAQKIIAVTQELKALGVAGSDIKTQGYNFYPNYRSGDRGCNEIISYTAQHSLQINIRNVTKAGKIIDTALNSGANEVNSLRYLVSDQSNVQREALHNALNDARRKADIIASGLGRYIVGIKSVSESTGSLEARAYNGDRLLGVKAVAVETNIEPGIISLDANVHIEYLLNK